MRISAAGVLCAALLVADAGARVQSAGGWPQFGGPTRDFQAAPAALAATWPAAGPMQRWSRPLGDGFAGIAVHGDALFTMYRRGNEELIVSLDAASGQTRWEHAAAVTPDAEQDLSQGAGPHATPLVSGDLVCAAGVTGQLRCLEAATGRLRWARDLVRNFGATVVFRGFSSSPLAIDELIVVQAGGDRHGVIAFDRARGDVRWHAGTHANANASPVLAPAAPGGPQVVAFFENLVGGYAVRDGREVWTHPHPQRFRDSITLPLVIGDEVVVSSPLDGGTRRIAMGGAGQPARERWHQPRLAVYYTNLALVDGMILGANGGVGPTFFTALDAASGAVLWQTREIKRANFLVAGPHLVMRDEEGALLLARVDRAGATVVAQAVVLEPGAPSPPTLVGTTLYVRDRRTIAAYELGAR